MAQFNLARIRYNWKNVWLPGATYIKDDIVRNGGNTYIYACGDNGLPDDGQRLAPAALRQRRH